MKMKSIRSLFTIAILGIVASFSYAGPGPQYWQTLHNKAQFKDLKAGDKIAYVCNQCKTVSEATIESPEKAMELCKEGAKVTCPACKMEAKVVTKQQRNGPATHTEVIYVNEKGEECMFIAKATDKK